MTSGTYEAWRSARSSLLAPEVVFPFVPATLSGLTHASLVITYNEVCHHHGTGILVKRLFGTQKNVVHLRSQSHYPYNDLGTIQLELGSQPLEPTLLHQRVLCELQRHHISRVVCVPFEPHEILMALAVKELWKIPLCLYLMDDQNIMVQGIPDGLMSRALAQSDLTFVISGEMRDAYENKFGRKCYILPPLIDLPVAPSELSVPSGERGVLIGNIWSFEHLQYVLGCTERGGLNVDWYCNGVPDLHGLSLEDLARRGLHFRDYLPETALLRKLRNYAYALVIGGNPNSEKEKPWLSGLSLPSRLVFLVCAACLPILALGAPGTPVANFVERFAVGRVSAGEPEHLRLQISELVAQGLVYRANAAKIAPLFDGRDMGQWLWNSAELGYPADSRFETAFSRTPDNFTPWLERSVPSEIFWQFETLYRALRRVAEQGFQPDFVIDVGCSTGVWSSIVQGLFPRSRFVLVDPLLDRYRALNSWYFDTHPEFECIKCALAAEPGEMKLYVSADLYGSSLFHLADGRNYDFEVVPVTTLDELLERLDAGGVGLLKLDVQSAEHLVLAGATRSLTRFEYIVLELTLECGAGGGKTFLEMQILMEELGYRYYDDAGEWRSPRTGRLEQKDVIFVRRTGGAE